MKKMMVVGASTFSDYHTTAMVTASLAKLVYRKNVNFEFTDLDELLSEINCADIVVKEVEKE